MPLQVHQFPCRSDNYGFLAHDPATQSTACIDTPDDDATNAALEKNGWRLTHILNTHHHGDHTGANLSLKERWGCTIVGAANDAERIRASWCACRTAIPIPSAGWTQRSSRCLAIPTGHIAYYFESEGIAFVGDTLFALGCGRLFEGTPEMMWNSLQKLMALPDNTVVYCAHEYTQANAEFALSVEPATTAWWPAARRSTNCAQRACRPCPRPSVWSEKQIRSSAR